MGCIPEASVGFPGDNAIIPRSAVTVLEILRQHGYGTAWIGKTHLTPILEITIAFINRQKSIHPEKPWIAYYAPNGHKPPRYAYDDPMATDRRTTQHFELLGGRAICQDGWWAGNCQGASIGRRPCFPAARRR
jgi:arylsulfatase A-like enzyme